MPKLRFFIFIFITTSIFSCKKERIQLPFEEFELVTIHPLLDVHFIHPDSGFIATGSDWDGGEILATTDGGQTWEIAAQSDYRLSGIDSDINGHLYSTGFVGRYFKRSQSNWGAIPLATYESFTDVSSWNGSQTLLVASGNFNTGFIVKIDAWANVVSRDSFSHDLEAITFIDENHAIASGYGKIVKSDDAGHSWYPLDITGDYYKDVQFPSSEVGYICGYSGSILKSTDGGNHWKKLRDGDKILVPDKRFNALHFEDELHGIIVGNNGLCWRTTDGGEHWQVVKKLPNYNFNAVFIIGDKAFLVSREGVLVMLSL